MIGQQHLLETMCNRSTLPQSSIIVGPKGSEQLDVCLELAKRFDLEFIDVQDKDILDDVINLRVKALLMLNLSDFDQNLLLKLVEEPNPYLHVVMLAESDSFILDTVKTRSFMFRTDPYTKEQLQPFAHSTEVLDLCDNPGQIDIANHTNIEALDFICTRLAENATYMTPYELLSVSNKVNFNDAYDKFDLKLFIKMLKKKTINKPKQYKVVCYLDTYVWEMADKLEGKQRFFDGCILQLAEA